MAFGVKLFIVVSLIKLLLAPAYHSTDFEVHRNWLAITNSQNISNWYLESTSQWTLDYPPFFAWFEWLMSHVARFFDPHMLSVTEFYHATPAAVLFQRLSVVVTDALYLYAIFRFLSVPLLQIPPHVSRNAIATLIFLNPGLLLVDHIHFQYNGFLMGLFLFSMSFVLEGKDLWGAVMFAVALNFKHIFLYVAPVYFMYLLSHYCFEKVPSNKYRFAPLRFAKLALVVGLVFAVSFGPFVVLGQLGQVLKRMFPFQRGLVHAYWAPNFWALYNAADKALIRALRVEAPTASMTSGVVGDITHVVLPAILPGHTLLLIVVLLLPLMYFIWKNSHPKLFPATVAFCALTFFMFGFHVHEKAILMITIPLSLVAFSNVSLAKVFFPLTTLANFSLFPLLFGWAEAPIKTLTLALHTLGLYYYLTATYNKHSSPESQPFSVSPLELAYLAGLPLLQLLSLLHSTLPNYPFLPLLCISVYCAAGVTWTWARFFVDLPQLSLPRGRAKQS